MLLSFMAYGVMPFSSLHPAVSPSSGDHSLEMLRCGFCPWWMGRWWRGSEGASSNKLDFPSKKSDLECSVCVLAAMEAGSAADGGCFFDWQVLGDSGGGGGLPCSLVADPHISSFLLLLC